MKLSEIKNTLDELAIQPTKSLGQNFLHDQNLAEWIVDALGLQAGDAWLEIGPGLGALTEVAERRSPRGILIEKDDRIIDYLRAKFPDLTVRHEDAARYDVRELFAQGPGVKVLGNLPYYISSQILFNFTRDPSPIASMIFTLQRELAERLAATPGTKEYGAPSLLIGRKWRVKYLRTLPASVFLPVPGVESAVVLLTPRSEEEAPPCDGELFARLVKAGFAQRRKQLRKMLTGEVQDWAALTEHLAVPETVRAEEMNLRQWIALTNFVSASSQAAASHTAGSDLQSQAQDVHGEMFDVVDEQNRVLRVASRHEVHTQGLLHRAVHIFVFNRAGELFLQRRSRWKDVHPLAWDSSAAGHLNAGDDYDETAGRELLEELGVEARCKPFGEIPACAMTGWEFVRIYQATHEGPFRLPPAEIECGEWFTSTQIDTWIAARPEDFAHGFLECWKVWKART